MDRARELSAKGSYEAFQLGHVSSDMDRKLVEHVAGSGNVFQLGHVISDMDRAANPGIAEKATGFNWATSF